MATKVIELVICHTCHKRVKRGNVHTKWEGHVYCERCFDLYLELIGPRDFGELIKED